MLQKAIIFGAGLVVGAGAAILALRDYYAEKEEYNVASVKAALQGDRSMIFGNADGDEESEPEVPAIHVDPETLVNKTSYNSLGGKLARDRDRTQMGQIAEHENYIQKPDEDDDPIEVYTIPPEAYGALGGGFEKIEVEYYEGNDTLLDVGAERVIDISSTIGREALERFGEYGEKDIVYVRNEKLWTDYCVSRNPGSLTDISKFAPSQEET